MFILFQHLLPKQWLTLVAGWLAQRSWGVITHWMIRRFIQHFQVQMEEAQYPQPEAYPTFNAFFTRPLRVGVRPLALTPWISPVDGTMSQCGAITEQGLFQAKGHHYTLEALLAHDLDAVKRYQYGTFATIYLSPKDYHRIHIPIEGTLMRMTHVPGALYSVNPETAAAIPALFAKNERVLCEFVTPQGPMMLILVGATIVGSMATVWHGVVNGQRPSHVRHWVYPHPLHTAIMPSGTDVTQVTHSVVLAKGDEMGQFLLGSTVILLLPQGVATLTSSLQAGSPMRLGQALAEKVTP